MDLCLWHLFEVGVLFSFQFSFEVGVLFSFSFLKIFIAAHASVMLDGSLLVAPV